MDCVNVPQHARHTVWLSLALFLLRILRLSYLLYYNTCTKNKHVHIKYVHTKRVAHCMLVCLPLNMCG